MKRSHISLKTKLAAALLGLRRGDGERLIPYEDAKQMTADQIISCFHLDHYPIPHANGGPDEAWNLDWIFIPAHREKTKRDVAAMAKTKRIVARQFAASAVPASPLRKRKWPSRKFPKRPSRRLRSGGV